MDFKIKKTTNLSNITDYMKTASKQINYQQQNQEFGSPKSFEDFESEYIELNDLKGQLEKMDKTTLAGATSQIQNVMTGQEKSNLEFREKSAQYANVTLSQLEEMYERSEAATLTTNTPTVDLSGTKYENVDNFNQSIKDNVSVAGYATREGVVAAALSLVGGYIDVTDTRLKYSQEKRQSSYVEGIDIESTGDFYMDCSSFAWWTLYNGGFDPPEDTNPNTWSQLSWASNNNYLKSIGEGQAGDFIIYNNGSQGHIVLIVGTYDGGYYCAEFSSTESGAKISKRDYGSLESSGYKIIDMEEFYSNADNVRQQ